MPSKSLGTSLIRVPCATVRARKFFGHGPRLYSTPLSAVLCLCLVALLAGCNQPPSGPIEPETPVFYPPLPQRPRIQFLRTLEGGTDVEAGATGLQSFIVGEDERDQGAKSVNRAYGLTFWKGKLFVCDSGRRRAVVFDLANKKFSALDEERRHRFKSLINISVAPDGTAYVTDTQAGQVVTFNSEGKPGRTMSTGPGMKPCDVIWREGKLYVSDLASGSVVVFDPNTGRVIDRIGERGRKVGQLLWPTNIAFGPAGRLYVCDTLAACVQVFDADGKFVQMIGSLGMSLGKMVRPKGIAVDRESRLYVADSATNSVQIFDRQGRLLLMLGGTGQGRGEMELPSKVYVTYEGTEYFDEYSSPDFKVEYLIFVTNQFGPNKISVYGFGTYTGAVPDEGPTSRPATSLPATSQPAGGGGAGGGPGPAMEP